MPEAIPRTGRIGVSSNDTNDLEEKKKELATVSAQLADANARATDLGAEIKILEARIAEVKKVTDAYGLGFAAQHNDLDDVRKLMTQKWTMAVAAVKDQKDAIDRVVKSVDDDLAAQSTKLVSTQKAADKAKQEWEAAVADAKTKQNAYAALQQVQKDADAQLKKIKALVDQASKAEAQADIASMYFLLEEATGAAKDVTVLSPDDYTAKVKTAQADAEASKVNLAAKKSASDQQAKQLIDMQTSFAAATAARQTTILTKLKDIKTTEPVAALAAVPTPPVTRTPVDTP